MIKFSVFFFITEKYHNLSKNCIIFYFYKDIIEQTIFKSLNKSYELTGRL